MLRVVVGSGEGGVDPDRLNSHVEFFQELFAATQKYKMVSQLRALFNIPFTFNLYYFYLVTGYLVQPHFVEDWPRIYCKSLDVRASGTDART